MSRKGITELNRREALRKGVIGGASVVGAAVPFSSGAVAQSDFDGKSDTEDVGGNTFELSVARRETTSDNMNPVGVLWGIDMAPLNHELRGFDITIEPTGSNPMDAVHYSYNMWGDGSGDDYPVVLDVAFTATTFLASTLSVLQLVPGEPDASIGTYDGGQSLEADFGHIRHGSFDKPRKGGIKSALAFDDDVYSPDPEPGTYTFEVNAVGSLWSTTSTGEYHIGSFDLTVPFDTTYE